MNSLQQATARVQSAITAPIAGRESDEYNDGWMAYYTCHKRSTLTSDEQRRGYDDARGEYCYHLALLAEAVN